MDPRLMLNELVEEWRPVVGFEGVYSVSSLSRVRREKAAQGATVGKILTQVLQNSGYLIVRLHEGQRWASPTVHSVVAAAFIGPRPPGADVNHRDGNKTHNAATNLEYTTRSGNMLHGFRNGFIRHTARLTSDQVQDIRRLHGRVPHTEIARQLGVPRTTVSSVAHGRNWKSLPVEPAHDVPAEATGGDGPSGEPGEGPADSHG